MITASQIGISIHRLWAPGCLSALALAGWALWPEPEATWLMNPLQPMPVSASVIEMRAKRKVQPLKGFLHSEAVVWERYEDGSGAILKDGRTLQIDLKHPRLDAILSLKPNRKMVLAYSEAAGVVLVDPAAGISIAVINMYGPHPIDSYLDSLDKYASTTGEITDKFDEGTRLWSLEIDRCVREFLAAPNVPTHVRENFVRLSKVRREYIERQLAFTGACVVTRWSSGSMRFIEFAVHGCDLHADLARQLLALRTEFTDWPPPSEQSK